MVVLVALVGGKVLLVRFSTAVRDGRASRNRISFRLLRNRHRHPGQYSRAFRTYPFLSKYLLLLLVHIVRLSRSLVAIVPPRWAMQGTEACPQTRIRGLATRTAN